MQLERAEFIAHQVSELGRRLTWLLDQDKASPGKCPIGLGNKDGERYKQLVWRGGQDAGSQIKIDLFIVLPPAQWGALLAIRTGPMKFSRLCVTPFHKGGAMPPGHFQREAVETPEEREWFAAINLPWWPPEHRTEDKLRAWLRDNRRAARSTSH